MAETYNVYWGIDAGDLNPVALGISELEISVPIEGILNYNTIYYWRVDAINAGATIEGDVWSFTSIIFGPPQISYVLIDGGSGPYDDPPGIEGTDWNWTGENNMIIVRRLVAAAKDAIWYESI